jgi:hypothetical protein
MLRVKKSWSTQDVTLYLKERERFFSRSLCTGLSLALIFHAIAFLTFYIKPFNPGPSWVFPSLNVEADIFDQGREVAFLDEELIDHDFLSPPNPIPSLPSVDELYGVQSRYGFLGEGFIDQALDRDRSAPPLPTFFTVMEPSAISETSLPYIESICYQPIEILISGDLAERPLLMTEELSKLKELRQVKGKKKLCYFSINYAVRIQPETGEVFWYERTQTSGVKEIDQVAESVLQHIKFMPSGIYEHISGIVTINIIRPENKKIEGATCD